MLLGRDVQIRSRGFRLDRNRTLPPDQDSDIYVYIYIFSLFFNTSIVMWWHRVRHLDSTQKQQRVRHDITLLQRRYWLNVGVLPKSAPLPDYALLQERQSQGWSLSTTSSETQVQTYLSEKTPLRKATHFSTGKNMLISFPLWLLLQPSISVPPAALWTVRDFLVPLQTSLMRTETGSNLTR